MLDLDFSGKHICKQISNYIGSSRIKKNQFVVEIIGLLEVPLACTEIKESIGIKYTGIAPVNWKHKIVLRQQEYI